MTDPLSILTALLPGWGSRGSQPVSPAAVDRARELIARLPEGTPEPQVAPGSSGDVQLEWRQDGIVLVADIGPEGLVSVSCDGGRWLLEVALEKMRDTRISAAQSGDAGTGVEPLAEPREL